MKGGYRPGAGRKPKPKLPSVAGKDVATELLDFIALDKNPHKDGCRCLNCRSREIADAQDIKVRGWWLDKLLSRRYGLPAQTIDQKQGFDQEQPFRLVIEHVGTAHPPAAKAK